MMKYKEELFLSSTNKYTLEYKSDSMNEKYLQLKDEIAYSNKVIFLLIFFYSLAIIIRIIRVVTPTQDDLKLDISSSEQLFMLIFTICAALAEGLVNIIQKLRNIRGIVSTIYCQFMMFYGSYIMFHSFDEGRINFDLSFNMYLFCSILAGIALSRNNILWSITYILCCILTIIFYFLKYRNNLMNSFIYTFYIIVYYLVLIFINYSYEYLIRMCFFYLNQQEKEINEWHDFFHNFPIAIFIVVRSVIFHINKRCAQIFGLKESNNKTLIDIRANEELEKEIKNKMNEFVNEEKKEEKILNILNEDDKEKSNCYFSRKTGKVEKYYELSLFSIHLEG